MFGIFKKKNFTTVISKKTPIVEFVPGVLALKDYYVEKFDSLENPVLSSKTDEELCFLIISTLLKESECRLMRCGNGMNRDLGPIRAPVLFFETYIFIGLSFGNQLMYSIIRPIVKSNQLMDAESKIKLVSLTTAIQNDPQPEDVENLLYQDSDLIIKKLIELRKGT